MGMKKVSRQANPRKWKVHGTVRKELPFYSVQKCGTEYIMVKWLKVTKSEVFFWKKTNHASAEQLQST